MAGSGCSGVVESRIGARISGPRSPDPSMSEQPATPITGVPISPARRRVVTASLLLGTFLASIEVTVVAAAMPSIVESLGGLSLYSWVFSSYLLTQTVTIPLYGRIADYYGRRPVYVFGVTLFLVGSALAAVAPSMHFLVAARALQGLGAGSVLPLTLTIFGDLFDVSARTRLHGLFSLVWGFSSLAGPLAGGLIVQHLSWRWVFFLNIPFGILSAFGVGWLLRESPPRRRHRMDYRGAALLSAATLALLLGLLPPDQRPLALNLGFWLGASAAFTLLFVSWEKRHPEPLVPLGLFSDRVHTAANVTGLLLGAALFGIVAFLPLYVQGVQGGTPLQAGAILIPLSLGWTTAAIVSGRIVSRVGFQFLVRTGSALVAFGSLVAFTGVRLDSLGVGVAGMAIYGLGMGAAISSFTVSVQERVSPEGKGIATALTQFSRSIGGSVGIAVQGAVLSRGLQTLPDGQVARATLAAGLNEVFILILVIALSAGVVGNLLFPRIAVGMTPRSDPNRDRTGGRPTKE